MSYKLKKREILNVYIYTHIYILNIFYLYIRTFSTLNTFYLYICIRMYTYTYTHARMHAYLRTDIVISFILIFKKYDIARKYRTCINFHNYYFL
jgi:hypothetical protein